MSGDIHKNNIFYCCYTLYFHCISTLLNESRACAHARSRKYLLLLPWEPDIRPPKSGPCDVHHKLEHPSHRNHSSATIVLFCGKRELTNAHRTLCFSITATFTKTVSTRFLFSFNIEHKLQLRSQMTQPPAAVNHRLAPWVGWRRTRSTLIQRDPIMIVSAGKCSQSRVILTSIVASTACTMINPEAMSTGPNSRETRTQRQCPPGCVNCPLFTQPDNKEPGGLLLKIHENRNNTVIKKEQ